MCVGICCAMDIWGMHYYSFILIFIVLLILSISVERTILHNKTKEEGEKQSNDLSETSSSRTETSSSPVHVEETITNSLGLNLLQNYRNVLSDLRSDKQHFVQSHNRLLEAIQLYEENPYGSDIDERLYNDLERAYHVCDAHFEDGKKILQQMYSGNVSFSISDQSILLESIESFYTIRTDLRTSFTDIKERLQLE